MNPDSIFLLGRSIEKKTIWKDGEGDDHLENQILYIFRR